MKATERYRVSFTLNGHPVAGLAEPRLLLADFLRYDLGATGTHVGCEHGVCGACTVCIDGAAVRSCLMLAVQAEGRDVRTVEGLAEPGGELSALQETFRRHHALQCGFCTAGILMSVSHWLASSPEPDEPAVRAMLSGHLCRCTGYGDIVRAVMELAAAERAREREKRNA